MDNPDQSHESQVTVPLPTVYEAFKPWRLSRRPANGASYTEFSISVGLRLFSFGAILAAFFIMITAKQIITVNVGLIELHATAKWTEDRTTRFYVVTLAIVATYIIFTAFVVGYFAFFVREPQARIFWAIILLDLLMAFLLTSSISASMSIGLVARQGALNEGWSAICDRTRHFCDVTGVAFIISWVGFVALLVVILLDIYILYQHDRIREASY